MSKTIPATHDIRAVDFDDVKAFFEEIEKDTNLLHADELKFARNFLGKFGATIPPFKEDDDDDDDMPDVDEVNETTNAKPIAVEEEEEEEEEEEDEEIVLDAPELEEE